MLAYGPKPEILTCLPKKSLISSRFFHTSDSLNRLYFIANHNILSLNSGTDAVLCAQDDKLSVQDALLCAQGRDDEVSIGPVELKKRRATVKSVTETGTQIFKFSIHVKLTSAIRSTCS